MKLKKVALFAGVALAGLSLAGCGSSNSSSKSSSSSSDKKISKIAKQATKDEHKQDQKAQQALGTINQQVKANQQLNGFEVSYANGDGYKVTTPESIKDDDHNTQTQKMQSVVDICSKANGDVQNVDFLINGDEDNLAGTASKTVNNFKVTNEL